MTLYSDKTAVSALAMNKRAGLAWLNILLVILLVGSMLPLFGGADGIHCVCGILLLAACVIHLAWHRRWIKAVILDNPKSSSPVLQCQRWLFWTSLLSGLLCGLSGLVALPSGGLFLPLLCLIAPIHALSGLTFLGLNIYHIVLHRNWFMTRIGRFFHIAGD